MTKFNDGGLAFPSREEMSPGQIRLHFGMTYRQWLAGMVVNGLLSNVWKDSGATYTEAKLANETIGIVNALIAEEEMDKKERNTEHAAKENN